MIYSNLKLTNQFACVIITYINLMASKLESFIELTLDLFESKIIH